MSELKIALPEPAVRSQPMHLATAQPVVCAEGFHGEEHEGLDRFRWMTESGVLTFAAADVERFMELWVLSEFQDLSQTLTCESGVATVTIDLVGGWAPVSLRIPVGANALRLRVNKPFPSAYYPSDHRLLAVRLRQPLLHRDASRHATVVRQHENSVRNVREMLDHRTSLESTPVSLGIDLHGVCNVKPPCVYCEWDYSKNLEGRFVDVPFTTETLREWGAFFDNSVNLVNCSIGEPFMMKHFDDLLDAFGDGGKVLEMTTNGQILTDRNIQKLLGRPIDLYISLDAATPSTYAKLRNDRFDAILRNLRRLVAAKGGPGHYPHVHLVFMPMRVNVHELEPFVRLCADLPVDRLVLRPLNNSPGANLDWERNGHHFQYQKELLPFDELVRVSGRAAELCRRYGVHLADQMDFGGAMGPQFDELFEEGRRSVMVPAAPVVSAAAPGAAQTEREAPLESRRQPQPLKRWWHPGRNRLRQHRRRSAPSASPRAPSPGRASTSSGAACSPAATAARQSPRWISTARSGTDRRCRRFAPRSQRDGSTITVCARLPVRSYRKSAESHALPVGQLARMRLRRWRARADHLTRTLTMHAQRTVQQTLSRGRRAVARLR